MARQQATTERERAIGQREQEEADRLARQEANREQVKGVLAKYQGDMEKALPEIYAVDPEIGMKIQKTWNDSRESDFNLKTAKLAHDRLVAQEIGRKAQGVTDQDSYGYFLANLKASGLPTDGMPETFDPGYVEGLKTKSLTVLENANLQEKQLAAEYQRWKGLQDLKDKAEDNARQDARHAQQMAVENARLGLERQRVGLEAQRVKQAGEGTSSAPLTTADAQLVEAVIANPAIYADLTPTMKSKLAGTLAARGFKQFATTPGQKAGGPNVGAIMGEIEGLSKKINTQGMGPVSNVAGWIRQGAAAGNLDNDVAEYESLVTGMIPMVARAVGHTGVLTQQDVDSVRNLFPKVGDNAALAKNKIARVKTLLAGTGAAAPPPTEKKADPLGIR